MGTAASTLITAHTFRPFVIQDIDTTLTQESKADSHRHSTFEPYLKLCTCIYILQYIGHLCRQMSDIIWPSSLMD